MQNCSWLDGFCWFKFDIEIKDQKGYENQIADHNSGLESLSHIGEKSNILKEFIDEQIFSLEVTELLWWCSHMKWTFSVQEGQGKWRGGVHLSMR